MSIFILAFARTALFTLVCLVKPLLDGSVLPSLVHVLPPLSWGALYMLVVPILSWLLSIVAVRIKRLSVALAMDLRFIPRIRVNAMCKFVLVLRMPWTLFFTN